ncbi:sigma-70 family RNA polymerase sigma factor [Nocardia sp. NRRL S-836]|uniref:sigma-70 family RNA polymerase sigma factor n=1 Tax=Nocardia sp. NRRL S-836 TaxID=1519492 RepID=UPI0006B0325F|nr:sigma-70 family RNA polymerase sigma factor [Nocardia sp. NRRL S-836]KOV80564.1 hypothetical protein ADL03_32785 [Nocardia sp. NRRL S-836]
MLPQDEPPAPKGAAPSSRSLEQLADLDLADLVRVFRLTAKPAVSQRAFELIFERCHSRVVAHVMGKGFRAEAAEDAAQEAFVAAWEGFHRIIDVRSTLPWLYTTAWRAAMRAEKRGRDPIPVGVRSALEEVTPPLHDHSSRIADSIALREAVERLPPGAREILILIMDEGLTAGEAADLMRISRITVRGYLRVAASRLALQLPEVAAEVRAQAKLTPPRVPAKSSITASMNFDQQLGSLSNRRREVLERYIYRGLMPYEIAGELRITPGCARVHVSLGLTDLAKRLGISRNSLVDQIRAARAA